MPPRITIRVPSRLGSIFSKKVRTAAEKAVKAATPKIKAAIADIVSEEGKRGLGGDRYEKEMQKPGAIEVTGKRVTVTISDPLLLAIERGVDSFDIKKKMLARAKSSKGGGFYVDVPFQHDPGTKGTTNTPGRSFTKTLTRKGIKSRIRVKHTRGITDDMLRRSGVTIRRISSKSPASSWWHPGFRGRNVLKKSRDRVRAATLTIIKAAFSDAGFKVS